MSDFDEFYAHVVSTGAIVGAAFGYLPDIAAFIGGIWYLIKIWESKTVQGWVGRKYG